MGAWGLIVQKESRGEIQSPSIKVINIIALLFIHAHSLYCFSYISIHIHYIIIHSCFSSFIISFSYIFNTYTCILLQSIYPPPPIPSPPPPPPPLPPPPLPPPPPPPPPQYTVLPCAIFTVTVTVTCILLLRPRLTSPSAVLKDVPHHVTACRPLALQADKGAVTPPSIIRA